jgi:Zn-dependent protease
MSPLPPAAVLAVHTEGDSHFEPVPVNFRALYNARFGAVLVAAAGPAVNFLLATRWLRWPFIWSDLFLRQPRNGSCSTWKMPS